MCHHVFHGCGVAEYSRRCAFLSKSRYTQTAAATRIIHWHVSDNCMCLTFLQWYSHDLRIFSCFPATKFRIERKNRWHFSHARSRILNSRVTQAKALSVCFLSRHYSQIMVHWDEACRAWNAMRYFATRRALHFSCAFCVIVAFFWWSRTAAVAPLLFKLSFSTWFLARWLCIGFDSSVAFARLGLQHRHMVHLFPTGHVAPSPATDEIL